MKRSLRVAIASAAVLALGCGSPSSMPATACVEEEPEKLGDACGGDGECGTWLVCEAGACELPPAASGKGGEPLELELPDSDEAIALTVEVARGDLERARGLGHRPCIVEGWGLLIDFPTVAGHRIGMRAMEFDLDLAFAGADGVVHTVYQGARAGGTELFVAEEPVAVVLETAAGEVDVPIGTTFRRASPP